MLASYDFYVNKYYGDRIQKESWNKYESQAEDYLNYFIRDRLCVASKDEKTQTNLKNAVCAIANGLTMIEKRTKQLEKMGAGGAVTSISSGKESISFADSALDRATTSENEKMKYLYEMCRRYLVNTVDINGKSLIYWGC